MVAKEASKETSYYPLVKDWLSDILQSYFKNNFHLEITANGKFSSLLKAQIPEHREIIFSFLKEAAPDITGFVVKEHMFQFVVVELKARRAKLDDVYQTKKYADLFDARYALLLSTVEIPEELRRLSRAAPQLLALPGDGRLTLIQLQVHDNSIGSAWFSDDPFAK